MPRLHEEVNEEWIHDKARHALDGLMVQRLDRPYLRGADGRLAPVSWEAGLAALAERLQAAAPERIAALAGDLADCETLYALRELLAGLGVVSMDCRQDGGVFAGPSVSWLFNAGIAGLEEADAVLLVGCNPRDEGALVNARLRKRFLRGGLAVANLGPAADLTYEVAQLGDSTEVLEALAAGRGAFAEVLAAASRPVVMVGSGILARPDAAAVLGRLHRLAEACGAAGPSAPEGWNGFSVLQRAASRAGGLMLGFVPGEGGRATGEILQAAKTGGLDLLWLLGADECDLGGLQEAEGRPFIVYQGHHGEAGAAVADLVLPSAAWTEKDGLYVNTEGRVQAARQAVFPPGEARADWKILRALSGAMGAPLPFDNLAELRRALFAAVPHLAELDAPFKAAWEPFGDASAPMSGEPFAHPVSDFYRTDIIARHSPTMARCSKVRQEARAGGLGLSLTGASGWVRAWARPWVLRTAPGQEMVPGQEMGPLAGRRSSRARGGRIPDGGLSPHVAPAGALASRPDAGGAGPAFARGRLSHLRRAEGHRCGATAARAQCCRPLRVASADC